MDLLFGGLNSVCGIMAMDCPDLTIKGNTFNNMGTGIGLMQSELFPSQGYGEIPYSTYHVLGNSLDGCSNGVAAIGGRLELRDNCSTNSFLPYMICGILSMGSGEGEDKWLRIIGIGNNTGSSECIEACVIMNAVLECDLPTPQPGELVYLVLGQLSTSPEAPVTIQPGVVIKFMNIDTPSRLNVRGPFSAAREASQPGIFFTSWLDGSVGGRRSTADSCL